MSFRDDRTVTLANFRDNGTGARALDPAQEWKEMKKNPLNSRFARDLRDDLCKFVVIALLLILTIGFASVFMVAHDSMIKA